MKTTLLILSVLTSASAMALEAIDCEAFRADANGLQIPRTPTPERMSIARLIYRAAPAVARCLYPDLKVEYTPIGERESASEGQSALTLIGLTNYRRGPYTYSVTTHKVPEGHQIAIDESSGDYIEVSSFGVTQ